MEREEYKCSGKKYNSEKAIISLTSWKARINTVSKTIFSLIKACPGFHIVLVLSEEEFPLKEEELPETLKLFVDNEIIELLWVYKNYKSFKKILFTLDKYRDLPIISADDDCIYTCNYAEELYNEWLRHRSAVISYRNGRHEGIDCTWGCATLYPPFYFKTAGIDLLSEEILSVGLDDNYYVILRKKLNLRETVYIRKSVDQILKFANEIKPLHDSYLKNGFHDKAYGIIGNLIGKL